MSSAHAEPGEGKNGASDWRDSSRYGVYVVYDPLTTRTYVGCTHRLEHRLRQHRRELAGGARATRAFVGRPEVMVYVHGFATRRAALSCEWHVKHAGRPVALPTWASWRLGRMAAALRRLPEEVRSTLTWYTTSEWCPEDEAAPVALAVVPPRGVWAVGR